MYLSKFHFTNLPCFLREISLSLCILITPVGQAWLLILFTARLVANETLWSRENMFSILRHLKTLSHRYSNKRTNYANKDAEIAEKPILTGGQIYGSTDYENFIRHVPKMIILEIWYVSNKKFLKTVWEVFCFFLSDQAVFCHETVILFYVKGLRAWSARSICKSSSSRCINGQWTSETFTPLPVFLFSHLRKLTAFTHWS